MKCYKIEIDPTKKQRELMHKHFGVCRFVYNLYLSENKKRYDGGDKFFSGYDCSKWLNNDFIPNNPSYSWIKEVGSKAVKKSIMDAETAYRKFFKGESKHPRYKNKNSRKSFYFPRNNATDLVIERHRGKIPKFGFVRFKEYGYAPVGRNAVSVTVSYIAGRYYASYSFNEETQCTVLGDKSDGIGIDLGVKDFAIVSNGRKFKNVNKTSKMKKLKKKLKRKQRAFSRKLIKNKKGKNIIYTANMVKDKKAIAKLYVSLSRKRIEYVRYVVNSLVKANSLPEYVSIENLNVKGMLKNKHLSDAIKQQLFNYFRQYLIERCSKLSVPVRIIGRYYPSSKMCSKCGTVNKALKLSDRVFRCPKCGYTADRDENASLNIRNCETYDLAC